MSGVQSSNASVAAAPSKEPLLSVSVSPALSGGPLPSGTAEPEPTRQALRSSSPAISFSQPGLSPSLSSGASGLPSLSATPLVVSSTDSSKGSSALPSATGLFPGASVTPSTSTVSGIGTDAVDQVPSNFSPLPTQNVNNSIERGNDPGDKGNASGQSGNNGSKPSRNFGGQTEPRGKSVENESGFPGGIAGIIGIAVVAVIAFLVVSVGLYKASEALPSGGILPFTWSDDSSSLDSVVIGDESPWDQVWRNASDPDITPEERAKAENAAAAIGGQFAGLLKPGAEKVRPPQVITRSAAVDINVALNRLASGDLSTSEIGSTASSSAGSIVGGGHNISPAPILAGTVASAVPKAFLPNMDLMVVLDASSSLQWRDYRRLKEALTGPGGLLDEVLSKAGAGSRVGLVEYAYDSLVVSELDSDQNRVRRRILGAFQGDMNNWNRESMFIYEVDEDFGGNVLRKVSSVREAHDARKRRESIVHEPGAEEILWDIEQAPTVSAKEVPNSMNGISREVHAALKWARFELLPVAANPEVQALINANKRLRRVLVINAGELTKGGDPIQGIPAAQSEVEDLKSAGVEVITLGVGEHQDPNLMQLATRSRNCHISAKTVDDVQGMQPLLAAAVLYSPRPSPSAAFSSAVAAALRKIRASRPQSGSSPQPLPPVVRAGGVAKEPRHGGVTKKRRSVFGRTKTRMPRGMSELSPWFNSTRKSTARPSFPSRRTTLRRFSSF